MLNVRVGDYHRVRRRIVWITCRVVLAQTLFALLIVMLDLVRGAMGTLPVGHFGIEANLHYRDVAQVLLISPAMFATGYLWVLLPVWLLRGGIQVHCHRCQWSLPVGWYQDVLPCPNCDRPFDVRTGDRPSGVSPESRREVPHTSAEGGP
jgi:hypothetical protein